MNKVYNFNMDNYFQEGIFGEKFEIVFNEDKEYIKKDLTEEDLILKEKIIKIYDLYEQLYYSLNIDILEQREVIIIKDIIAFPEEKQALPISIYKYEIEEKIEEKIKILEERVKDERCKNIYTIKK